MRLGSFYDELEKIAEARKLSLTHPGEKIVLLSKQKNLPPLIMKMLKETPVGVTVTIDPDYRKNTRDKNHRPNGFYTLKGDRIHLTSLNAHTLAHEMGHAQVANEGGIGAALQSKYLYPMFRYAPLLGLAGGMALHRVPHPVIKALCVGAPFLMTTPALASEAKASINGHEILKRNGANKKELAEYKSQMMKAFGTYAAIIPHTGITTALGYGLSKAHLESELADQQAKEAFEKAHHIHEQFRQHGFSHRETEEAIRRAREEMLRRHATFLNDFARRM